MLYTFFSVHGECRLNQPIILSSRGILLLIILPAVFRTTEKAVFLYLLRTHNAAELVLRQLVLAALLSLFAFTISSFILHFPPYSHIIHDNDHNHNHRTSSK